MLANKMKLTFGLLCGTLFEAEIVRLLLLARFLIAVKEKTAAVRN